MSNALHYPIGEPIAPPIIRRPTPPKVPVKARIETTRCYCCKRSMPADAAKCPFCREWRRDIKNCFNMIRYNAIMLMVGLIGVFGLCFYMCPNGHFKKTGYPWHEKVQVSLFDETTIQRGTFSGGTVAIPLWGFPTSTHHWKFSIEKFLSHPLGWFVIIGFLGAVFSAYKCLIGFDNLKRIGYKF